jgi:hypothetical protein
VRKHGGGVIFETKTRADALTALELFLALILPLIAVLISGRWRREE